MKTSNLFIAALAALTLFSCSKEKSDIDSTMDNAKLTIRISNPPASKAVEDPGTAVAATVTYANSVAFVATSNGAIKKAIVLESAAGAAGQTITDLPTSGQVFVVANIPTANLATIKALLTVKAVQDYVLKIADAGTFPNVVLSNANGAGAAYTATGNEGETKKADVTVSISPAMSRLELAKLGLTAQSEIKSFTVTGVFIDKVYESFVLKGDKGAGTQVDIKQDVTNATIAYYKDEANLASAAQVVVPASGKSWAYQIPAGNTPNMIIRVTSVVMKDNNNFDGSDGTKVYYITAKLDVTDAGTTVTRAKIYPMAEILFDESNLHETPNPELTGAEIKVTITPQAWAVGNIGYTLD